MMIKKGDFIEIDYTAKMAEEGIVFDTTELEEAKKAGLLHEHKENEEHTHDHNHLHKEDLHPVIICVGEKQVLPGLDNKIDGLELGKHTILLDEEEAFGKKNTKLLKLMPLSLFNKQQIRPFVGLTLDVDGSRGVVRSISGGRVIVDFNHPLSGKKIEYKINIKRLVSDEKEQLESVLKLLKFPYDSVELNGKKAKINTKINLPKEVNESLEKDLNRITKLEVEIVFPVKEEKKEENHKSPDKKTE
ncbi:MAG: FKBP-type peptidyl-prolyl cis-trans isomerase [Candidatus Nanoarchaeia archaeon]